MQIAPLYMLSTDTGVSRASRPGSYCRSWIRYAKCGSGAATQMKRVLFLANGHCSAALLLSVPVRNRRFHVFTDVGWLGSKLKVGRVSPCV